MENELKTYIVKVVLERAIEAQSANEAVWAVICDTGDMSEDIFTVNGEAHFLEPQFGSDEEIEFENLYNSLED